MTLRFLEGGLVEYMFEISSPHFAFFSSNTYDGMMGFHNILTKTFLGSGLG
jgi:hypothetical protein